MIKIEVGQIWRHKENHRTIQIVKKQNSAIFDVEWFDTREVKVLSILAINGDFKLIDDPCAKVINSLAYAAS